MCVLRRGASKNYDVMKRPSGQLNSTFGILLVHYVDFHKIYALCLYPAISGGDLRDNCLGKWGISGRGQVTSLETPGEALLASSSPCSLFKTCHKSLAPKGWFVLNLYLVLYCKRPKKRKGLKMSLLMIFYYKSLQGHFKLKAEYIHLSFTQLANYPFPNVMKNVVSKSI